MKRCGRCKLIKDNSEFSKQGNGLQSYCKKCAGEYNDELRFKVNDIYGNKCACCGETTREFLTLDHIWEGMSYKTGEIKNWQILFRRIIRNEVDRSDYQLLCWNCNCAKGKYGYCPHKLQRVNDKGE